MSDELEQQAASADAEAARDYAESASDYAEAIRFATSGDTENAHDRARAAGEEHASGDAEHGQAEELRHEAEAAREHEG